MDRGPLTLLPCATFKVIQLRNVVVPHGVPLSYAIASFCYVACRELLPAVDESHGSSKSGHSCESQLILYVLIAAKGDAGEDSKTVGGLRL